MRIEEFKRVPVVGILRGIEEKDIVPITEAVIASGLTSIEITMNTVGASDLIKKLVKCSQGRLFVGAGTVLSMDELKQALDVGASFIVSPTLVPDVVSHCAKNDIPVFPGALTPKEIYDAWNAGASMVKVFPAHAFGPKYFKDIRGPFGRIELLACGGVKPDNIGEFFNCGASAVAFGGSIFRKNWIQEKEFSRITQAIKELLSQIA